MRGMVSWVLVAVTMLLLVILFEIMSALQTDGNGKARAHRLVSAMMRFAGCVDPRALLNPHQIDWMTHLCGKLFEIE